MEEPEPDRPLDLDELWAQLVACHNDVPALLRVVANRVVELFGDGSVLTIVGADGETLEPRAVVHADPEVDAAMRAVLAAAESRVGEGIAGTVAADRRSILLNDLAPQTVAETTPMQYRSFVSDHPIRAMMIAPLVASGELIGTLGSVRIGSDEPYEETDLRLLESLADRAALAVHDAMAGPRAIGDADHDAIYRNSIDGVLVTTPDGHILAANPSACAILGRTESDIVHGGRDAIVVDSGPRLAAALSERAAVGRVRGKVRMRRGDGSTFLAEASSTIYTTSDRKVRSVVFFRDVSDQAVARQMAMARVAELEEAADHDLLTGLWNRRGFGIAAEQALATADRQGTVIQVVFVDVDGLKAINDASGHLAGDEAIRAVAAAIDRTIREEDAACRFGGDEFVFLLLGTPSDEVPAIVARIHDELEADRDAPESLGFSTGVVERMPGQVTSLDELIDASDRDMYRQKVLRRLRRTS